MSFIWELAPASEALYKYRSAVVSRQRSAWPARTPGMGPCGLRVPLAQGARGRRLSVWVTKPGPPALAARWDGQELSQIPRQPLARLPLCG